MKDNLRAAVPSLDKLRDDWSELDGLALVDVVLTGPLAGQIAMVSSFGAESAVLLDMVARVDHRTPVIFLETGKLFSETLAYHEELVGLLGLKDVRIIRPERPDLERFDPNGRLWREDADMCCHIRKTLPLDRALEGFSGWITGRKRFQGGLRAALPTVEIEAGSGLLKLNPLASWSVDDIRHYRRLRQLPPHPLVAQGFTSIGCAPCTRAVRQGEDQRAGRWAHLDKTECGIHSRN